MVNEKLYSDVVESWLQPLGDASEPCGKDMEYDNEFLDLIKSAEGKPETQFGPGEPPNWREVKERSAALMNKTRDLRISVLWVRAVVNLDGFAAFPSGIQLLEGLISCFWDHLHPMLDSDDGDPYARANALATLPRLDGLLGDLRQSVLFSVRGVGELRIRTIEIALNQLAPKADEIVLTRDQLVQMLTVAVASDPGLHDQIQAALDGLKTLGDLLKQRLGAHGAPDLNPIANLVRNVQKLMPTDAVAVADAVNVDGETGESVSGAVTEGSRGQQLGAVWSRDDALRAIDLICAYLDKAEPTNPAQLLLRRAYRLINKNFLQLIQEFAPDALDGVAHVLGVNPDSISSQQ